MTIDNDAIRQLGDVGKCPQCGKQSRSYSRGCSQCGFGRPSVDELTAALERALDAKYAALGEVGQLRVQLGRVEDQLTAANRRADGLDNDLRSAVKANTAWANGGNTNTWSAPAEPTDVTAVRDRAGQLWVCPGRPGNNLWWHDQLGRGIGYEWHQLLVIAGPLTAADKAEATR